MLSDGTSTIASIEIESAAGNTQPEYNMYFNNLVITTVPEVSAAAVISACAGQLWLLDLRRPTPAPSD